MNYKELVLHKDADQTIKLQQRRDQLTPISLCWLASYQSLQTIFTNQSTFSAAIMANKQTR